MMKEFLIALLGGRGDLDAWLECNNEQECRDVIIPIVQQRDELLSDLKALVDCISETRGKNADDALHNARATIAKCEA